MATMDNATLSKGFLDLEKRFVAVAKTVEDNQPTVIQTAADTTLIRAQLDATLVPTMERVELAITVIQTDHNSLKFVEKNLQTTMEGLQSLVNPIVAADLISNSNTMKAQIAGVLAKLEKLQPQLIS